MRCFQCFPYTFYLKNLERRKITFPSFFTPSCCVKIFLFAPCFLHTKLFRPLPSSFKIWEKIDPLPLSAPYCFPRINQKMFSPFLNTCFPLSNYHQKVTTVFESGSNCNRGAHIRVHTGKYMFKFGICIINI